MKKTIDHLAAVLVLLPATLCILISCKEQDSDIIGMYDLRYTLSYDLNDTKQVESLWDDIHAVATLQGIVNRKAPRLFIHYIVTHGIDIDSYWWDKYREPGRWLHEKDTMIYQDIVQLIEAYKKDINGVVLYDSSIASTSNVASAVAGIENLIAVRYDTDPNSLYSRIVLNGPELKVKTRLIKEDGTPLFTGTGIIPGTGRMSTGSLKNDPYIWFIENYMKTDRCSGEFGAYYIDQKWREKPTATVVNHHTLTNHDFFVSKKAFFFDLSPWGDEPATDDQTQVTGTDLNTLREFLSEAYRINKGEKMCYIGGFPSWAFKYTQHAGGIHEDVATEWEFSKLIGAYNAFKDADAIGYGALANASFWTHFPLKEKYPQRRVSLEELKQRGYVDEDGKVDFKGRNFFIFYVGDYDASSWVVQRTPSIWDDENRGKVPMMWAISPVLENRVPMALDYYRESATHNDYFVAADNGAGYLMPGMLQEPRESGFESGLDTWANHCKPYYERWDLTITGFIIDGTAPGLSKEGLDCYASFSPDGIVPQKVPLTLLHDDMPVLRSDYDIIADDPKIAVQHMLDRVRVRPVPFHWFRNILKTPTWYVEFIDELHSANPDIELLDAPTFFELYRIWLRQKPAAATGKIEME